MSVLTDLIDRSRDDSNRKEDISDIERLKPQELYRIEPGQIVLFVAQEGIDQQIVEEISELLDFLRRIDIIVRLNIIPTANESLINHFSARNPLTTETPYEIVIGDCETIAGFAEICFGKNINEIIKSVTQDDYHHIRIRDLSPIKFKIDPNDNLAKENKGSSPYTDNTDLQCLPAKSTNELGRNSQIEDYKIKLKQDIWECVYLDIYKDIDVQGLVKEIEDHKDEDTSQYQLSLKIKEHKSAYVKTANDLKSKSDLHIESCDIYVGEQKLELTAIQKAIYLTFILKEEGETIDDSKKDFTQLIQNIYRQLPDKSSKATRSKFDLAEGEIPGILATDYIQPKTLRGYFSEIKRELYRKVPNYMAVLELAVEGEKRGAPYKIRRTTPELREKIKDAFDII